MSDEQVPISERAAHLSRVFYGTTTPLLAICIPALITRVYIKARPWRLGFDDLFIVIGFVLAIADWVLILDTMFLTPRFISPDRAAHAAKLAYIAIALWGITMACIKTAIALTYLRIQSSKGWVIFLCAVICSQLAYAMGNTFFVFLECHPAEAAWDMRLPRSSCVSNGVVRVSSYLGSSVNISTDILLSLAPLAFLHKLHRPFREKLLICFLMGMGLFASFASIMKAVVVRKWGQPGVDTWSLAVSLSTWTVLEEFLALFAACAPALKLPLQRVLRAFGFSLTPDRQSNGPSSGFGRTVIANLSRNRYSESKIQETTFPSIAPYANLEPDETIELSAPDTITLEELSRSEWKMCRKKS